jgi:hypothetical protein
MRHCGEVLRHRAEEGARTAYRLCISSVVGCESRPYAGETGKRARSLIPATLSRATTYFLHCLYRTLLRLTDEKTSFMAFNADPGQRSISLEKPRGKKAGHLRE